jgi:hypothetical protein
MNILKKQNEFSPIVITPPTRLELPDFQELGDYRGLFFFLIRRDIRLRFQQTVIGVLWVALQPLIRMMIFFVILGALIKVPTGGIPYQLFFLSSFVVWQFFPQVVNNSVGSLVEPCPELFYQSELHLPWQRKRFSVSQGITGLRQIQSLSDKSTFYTP